MLFLVGAFWGAALFVKETFIIGSKHISIPDPNSKNLKSYVQLKVWKILDFEHFGPRIVGKSMIFSPQGIFLKFSSKIKILSKYCYEVQTKYKTQASENIGYIECSHEPLRE